MKAIMHLKGGTGSGNFNHAGRPGEVGGSSSDGGSTGKLTSNDISTINVWEENVMKVREIRIADAEGVSSPVYDDFMKAIDKLPDYKGNLYRGIVESDLSRLQILTKYDKGKVISFDAVSSTSKKLDAAAYFSSTVFDWDAAEFVTPPKEGRIVLKLLNAIGKDLASAASIPEQAEVVVKKGAKYRIINSAASTVVIDGVKYNFLLVTAEHIQ